MNHDTCPPLDDLLDPMLAPASRRHLKTCDACSGLVAAVADGAEVGAGGEACEEAELLIAVMSKTDLSTGDREGLTAHLADCGACRTTARSVLLDLGEPDRREAVRAPVAAATVVPLRARPQSKWVLPAAAVIGLAAAALLVGLLSSGGADDDRGEDSTGPIPAGQRVVPTAPKHPPTPPTPQPVKRPPVKEPPVKEPPVKEPPVVEPPVKEPPVVEAPVVEPPGPDEVAKTSTVQTPAELARELNAEIDRYARSGQYKKAIKACDASILRGKTRLASMKRCVLVACRSGRGTKAKGYIARLRSPLAKENLTVLCLRYGIKL